MASAASLVLADLLTVLRADLGDYDLSTVGSTPRVVIADGGAPPVAPPYVLLSAPSVQISNEASLGSYRLVGTLTWWAFVAATTDTTEARAMAALDLGTEVIVALEAGHRNSAMTALFALTVFLSSIEDVFADGPEIPPGMAIAQGTLRFERDLDWGA